MDCLAIKDNPYGICIHYVTELISSERIMMINSLWLKLLPWGWCDINKNVVSLRIKTMTKSIWDQANTVKPMGKKFKTTAVFELNANSIMFTRVTNLVKHVSIPQLALKVFKKTFWPEDGTKLKVKGMPKFLGFILWGLWMWIFTLD